MSALIAVISLALTVVLLPVPGGVVFAPFTFGMFVLALLGVLGGLEDRTVRPHEAQLEPRRWRQGR